MSIEKEVVNFLRTLRKCGFPVVVNPLLERMKNNGQRNVWYIKAAMQLKNLDMTILTDEQYKKLEELMPVKIFEFIPVDAAEKFGLPAKLLNDVLPLAVLLLENIENTTQEVFGEKPDQHQIFKGGLCG